MFGGALEFDFSLYDAYTPPAGDTLEYDRRLAGYVPPFGGDLSIDFGNFDAYTPPAGDTLEYQFGFIDGGNGGLPGGTLIIIGHRMPWEKEATPVNATTDTVYERSGQINTDYSIKWQLSNDFSDVGYSIAADYQIDLVYTGYKIDNSSNTESVTLGVSVNWDGLKFNYVDWNIKGKQTFTVADVDYAQAWKDGSPIESSHASRWEGLDGFDWAHSSVLLRFEKSFKPTDVSRWIRWGYGINNFVVGGITTIPSNPAEDAIDPPDGEVIEHINYEVFIAVNVVNISEVDTGTSILFDNFTIQNDIESFAWTVQFDVLNKASFDAIRPQGKTLKLVDIEINNETFRLVVSKGNIQRRQGEVVYRCTGWSQTKLLADPYAAKRSFTDTSPRTAAQIVDRELTGTGFDYTWSTVDWQIPAGVHSYQDKTPLGAIIAVAESVGAVIVPHPNLQQFDVRPYYPTSPWNWGSAGLQRSMNELAFFEINNDTLPKANPDGVYVYGEDDNGVGVKAVRQGFPGQALLPDVVNKYITANVAGQERGRVEVSKNSFMEKYDMTTYVDENGIIKPHDLIQFTDVDGGTWRGMVLSTRVACQRVGTALTQSITVVRFYDD